jgi:AraC-like DNA-binding protein
MPINSCLWVSPKISLCFVLFCLSCFVLGRNFVRLTAPVHSLRLVRVGPFRIEGNLPERMNNLTGIFQPKTDANAAGIHFWRPDELDGILLHRGASATHPYPRHWHEELHLCAYESGSGHLGHRGNSYVVSSGSLVLMPPGEVHENWVKPGWTCSYRGVYLEMPMLQAVAHQITRSNHGTPEFSLQVFEDAAMRQCLTRLHRAVESGASLLYREELLLELIRLLTLRCSTNAAFKINHGGERDAVRRVRGFIDEHFADSVALRDLARVADLSPFHLHRVFCQETGMPPHAYQTQVRVNRAKEMLRHRRPLSQVALATGFADQSHLTRHFRRVVGVTPGRYSG